MRARPPPPALAWLLYDASQSDGKTTAPIAPDARGLAWPPGSHCSAASFHAGHGEAAPHVSRARAFSFCTDSRSLGPLLLWRLISTCPSRLGPRIHVSEERSMTGGPVRHLSSVPPRCLSSAPGRAQHGAHPQAPAASGVHACNFSPTAQHVRGVRYVQCRENYLRGVLRTHKEIHYRERDRACVTGSETPMLTCSNPFTFKV